MVTLLSSFVYKGWFLWQSTNWGEMFCLVFTVNKDFLFKNVFPFRVMGFNQGSWDFTIIQAQNCPDCLCSITKISLQTDQLCGNERTVLSLCLFNSWPFLSDHPKGGCHKSDGVCVKWTLEVKFWPRRGQYFIWNSSRQTSKSFLRIAASIRW